MLSNQTPAYHPRVLQGESSSRNKDNMSCWPENVCFGTNRMDGQHHPTMYVPCSTEDAFESTRNQLSNAIFDSLPKSTMNADPNNIQGFHGCNETTEESLQQWHQSTDELLSSLLTHDVAFSLTKVRNSKVASPELFRNSASEAHDILSKIGGCEQ
ncbi:hypothetical protein E3N88_26779 [Mikania micrantha]|uniref:Uncharacterized protein n=1 Tax=Mikania micrantha TaxID=192012 RepID=A0A5N6MUZ7_9ASTR|nr:hypothetical protein E3N88_26779 [Mikania micrantha]